MIRASVSGIALHIASLNFPSIFEPSKTPTGDSVGKLILFIALIVSAAWAQPNSPRKPNVAVLPFQGGKSVEPEQLNFMTGSFTSALIRSGAFTVLDRSRMDVILKEQGFQQSGACTNSQCQVQMGQLLGVDGIVTGNLVQFGGEYAFHLDFVDVNSGQIVRGIDLSEKGALEDVYKIFCEKGAQAMSQKENSQTNAMTGAVPHIESHSTSTRHKIALALMGGSLVSAGLGVYYNQKAIGYRNDYDANMNLPNPSKAVADRAYNNIEDMKTNRVATFSGAGVLALAGIVLWFWPEGDSK